MKFLSDAQLERLYRQAYYRMSRGDGYQPFGYDFRTLRLTKPGWYTVISNILDEMLLRGLVAKTWSD